MRESEKSIWDIKGKAFNNNSVYSFGKYLMQRARGELTTTKTCYALIMRWMQNDLMLIRMLIIPKNSGERLKIPVELSLTFMHHEKLFLPNNKEKNHEISAQGINNLIGIVYKGN